LPSSLPRASRSERIPDPLPPALIPDLIRQQPILLCLDYDGTLSEIVDDPAQARPLGAIPRLLASLAERRGRITVAVVSGREIAELQRLLGLSDGLEFVGVHGLEMMRPGGRREVAAGTRECMPDLAKIREWLAGNVPKNAGFVTEDKVLSIALHYRKADAALARKVHRAFEQFIRLETPTLKAGHGKMVMEAMPKPAGKGDAVVRLAGRIGERFSPVYFGDDLSDEDAFAVLRGRGITVLVGKAHPSAARYRVDNPARVVKVLDSIANALRNAPAAG
jgi:trehalose 6-phosphate phosphatase